MRVGITKVWYPEIEDANSCVLKLSRLVLRAKPYEKMVVRPDYILEKGLKTDLIAIF